MLSHMMAMSSSPTQTSTTGAQHTQPRSATMNSAWKVAVREHLIAVNHKPQFSHPVVKMSTGEKTFFAIVFLGAVAAYLAL